MIIDKNIVSDVIIKLRNIVLFKLDNDILIMHIQCPRLKISIIIQAYFCGLFWKPRLRQILWVLFKLAKSLYKA